MFQQHILVTVDNVIFSILRDKLCVLLTQRSIEPFDGYWCLPGGFVLENETLEQAAYRKLEHETGIDNVYLEQLYTFGAVDRDPRGRVVTVAYMAVTAEKYVKPMAGEWTKAIKFFPIDKLPKMAFDHKNIVEYSITRLRYKMEYTNIAQFLLPTKFKFIDLQKAYEIIFDKPFDKRNFRKKIMSLGLVKETGETEMGGNYRPPKLFEFVDKDLKMQDII